MMMAYDLQYFFASEHEPCGEGRAVGIRDEFERRHGLRNPEVRPLPFGDAAVRRLQSHGVGAVQGGCVESFLRIQAQFDAGERHDELHVARRGRARIEVRGDGHAQSDRKSVV